MRFTCTFRNAIRYMGEKVLGSAGFRPPGGKSTSAYGERQTELKKFEVFALQWALIVVGTDRH